MFDYLSRWLENLAFYMILMTAVLQALPDNSYQKYIRFFCGMILVVMLLSPFMKLAGMEGRMRDLYRNAQCIQMKREMEAAARDLKRAAGAETGE